MSLFKKIKSLFKTEVQQKSKALEKMDLAIQESEKNQDITKQETEEYVLQKANEILHSYPKEQKKDNEGFVYILKEHKYNTYKIGKTKNVEKRLNEFHVKLPYETTVENLIFCKDHHKAEILFHELFKGKRLDGEWFRLTEDDLEKIRILSLPTKLIQAITGETNKISENYHKGNANKNQKSWFTLKEAQTYGIPIYESYRGIDQNLYSKTKCKEMGQPVIDGQPFVAFMKNYKNHKYFPLYRLEEVEKKGLL